MIRYLRAARRRGENPVTGTHDPWTGWFFGPEPEAGEPCDPCGNPPISGGLCEDIRTAAITTLIAAMGRHAR